MDHRHVVERGYSSGRASPRFVSKKRGQKDLGSQVILCGKRLCAANDCSTMKPSRLKSGHGLSWPAWCVPRRGGGEAVHSLIRLLAQRRRSEERRVGKERRSRLSRCL